MATRKGYGQVEPNHLSAQHNGQIYAQLPAQTTTTSGTGSSAVTTVTKIEQLENGQFLNITMQLERQQQQVTLNGCLFTMKKNYMMKDIKDTRILQCLLPI